MRILVTGSVGLVGSLLVERLRARGDDVVPFDLRDPHRPRDILDPAAVARAVDGVDGIVHLAAISRVAWGEMHPAVCQAVNADGTAVVRRRRARLGRAAVARPRQLARGLRRRGRRAGGRGRAASARQRLRALQAGRRGDRGRGRSAHRDPAALERLRRTARPSRPRGSPSLTWRALKGLPLIVTGADAFFDFTHVEDTVGRADRRRSTGSPTERRPLSRDQPRHRRGATTLGALAETVVALTGVGLAHRRGRRGAASTSRATAARPSGPGATWDGGPPSTRRRASAISPRACAATARRPRWSSPSGLGSRRRRRAWIRPRCSPSPRRRVGAR